MIKVLSVNTNEKVGGAAIAANRIHHGVNAMDGGVHSIMFVKNKQTADTTVHSVDEFIPHHALYRAWQWVKQKVENKYWHALWHPYKHTTDKNFKSDLRGMDIGHALQTLDYDVLHLHWINQRFIQLKDIPNDKPIIWTLHDSWAFCGECHYFLDCDGYQKECGCCPQLNSKNPNDLSHKIWLAKQKCYAQKHITIVSPSRWLADCARQSSLFHGCDIRVIPNCLDTDVFRPLSKDEIMSIAEHQQNVVISRVLREATQDKRLEKPLLLYGAMNAATDRIKGFSSLLSALQILDKQGSEANLVVFGANATDLPLNFEHISVTFVGYIGNTAVLTALYSIADVMVVPSYTEVFGQTASESMACGTPVAAFRCTGIQDVVGVDGGYLAEPYSESDLAHGIQECITHSAEWGITARESVIKKYAIDVVAKQYVDLYKELVK